MARLLPPRRLRDARARRDRVRPRHRRRGSFFPAWIVCIAIGVALSFVAHRLFVATRLHAHLGPPFLIYSCLGLLFTLASWLVLYRT